MSIFGRKRIASNNEESDPRSEKREDTSFFTSGHQVIDAGKVKILFETIAELISTTDYEQLLRSIVDNAIRIVGAERGILFLFDERDPRHLQVKVARDNSGRNIPSPVEYSRSITKEVATTGNSKVVQVTSHDQRDLSQSIVDMKLRAAMCVRLQIKEKRLGVIYVDSRASHREFTQADLRFFDALAASLAIAVENARLVRQMVEGERAREQVKIARHIQEGLLPKTPRGIAGFDVAGWSTPAEDALGDYYDFVQLPDQRLVVAIGDVAGHGIGPAILMSSARAVLRSFADPSFRVDKVLARLSDRFYEDTGGDYYMSMFLGVLDPSDKTLIFGNAGHHPPILLRRGGTELVEIKGKDLALGFESSVEYAQRGPITLESGDVLILMTDGILEARAGEEFFGRDRLVASARRHLALPARELIAAIHKDALEFTGHKPSGDDLTLVAIKAS